MAEIIDVTYNGLQTKKYGDLTSIDSLAFDDGIVFYHNGLKSGTVRELHELYVKNMHRNVVLMRDVTAAWYDGDRPLKSAVANGDFSTVFPGDYIIGRSTGTKYWIIDLDCFYNTGSAALTNHHLVIFPATSLGSAVMNDSNTTVGGYKASKMYTTTLPAVQASYFEADFGDDLLAFDNLITNAINSSAVNKNGLTGMANGWEWRGKTRKCDLLSEIGLTGSQHWGNGYDASIQKEQFALFRICGVTAIIGRTDIWLSDIASATSFAYWNSGGSVYDYGASGSRACRPFALIG